MLYNVSVMVVEIENQHLVSASAKKQICPLILFRGILSDCIVLGKEMSALSLRPCNL